jgi:hypothetical protein
MRRFLGFGDWLPLAEALVVRGGHSLSDV